MFQENDMIDKNITHKIKIVRMFNLIEIMRSATGVFGERSHIMPK